MNTATVAVPQAPAARPVTKVQRPSRGTGVRGAPDE